MLKWLVNFEIISVLIYIFGVACFLSLFIVGVCYLTLEKKSSDMSGTNSPLLKMIKLKYENCFRLKLFTNDVQAFINRYLFKKKIFKVPLYYWEHIALEMIYLIMMLGFLGTFINVVYYQQTNTRPNVTAFQPGIVAFLIVSMLVFIRTLLAIDSKKIVFYSNVIDYLENVLKNKLVKELQNEVGYEKNQEIEKMEKQMEEIERDIKNNKSIDKCIYNGNKYIFTNPKKTEENPSRINEDFIDEVINQLIAE